MISKLLVSTHWTADEAEIVMDFLDELKSAIAQAYAVELSEKYQAEEPFHTQIGTTLDDEDFDDVIPF